MDRSQLDPVVEVTVFTPLSSPAKVTLPKAPVSIGRASECTIPIKDRFLSRKHAELMPVKDGWILRDCDSANGTWLNGTRVAGERALRAGDRIRVGDSEIVFQITGGAADSISLAEVRSNPTISIPLQEILDTQPGLEETQERLRILNALAIELIEDRPMETLFGFVVDRIFEHLDASRVALAALDEGGRGFSSIEVRRRDLEDRDELAISRTLLDEVVQEKKALSFTDVALDAKLAAAQSIVSQGIRSVIVAPLLGQNEVMGVLYVDYLGVSRVIQDEDVRFLARIARIASMKLETTRLREEAVEMRLMEEELRTAAAIQRRLLPENPPAIEGWTVAGSNRPCRTVSGDYFDYVRQADGRLSFVIADVSGKGVTAALLMTSLQSAYRIFVKQDPMPAPLLGKLNAALCEIIPPTKFVTLLAGLLDPATGRIDFANAGHTPPFHVHAEGIDELRTTDLVLGLFGQARYRPQSVTLAPGDSLVLFTDGATECASAAGEELGAAGVAAAISGAWRLPAETVARRLEDAVVAHGADCDDLGDDLTLVVVSRDQG